MFLVMNTFISTKGTPRTVSFSLPLNLASVFIWSTSSDIRRIWASFDLIVHSHQDLSCLKSGVGHFSAVLSSVNRGWPTPFLGQLTFWCEYGISQCSFPGLHWSLQFLRFRLWFDKPMVNCCQGRLTVRVRARCNALYLNLCNRITDTGLATQYR